MLVSKFQRNVALRSAVSVWILSKRAEVSGDWRDLKGVSLMLFDGELGKESSIIPTPDNHQGEQTMGQCRRTISIHVMRRWHVTSEASSCCSWSNDVVIDWVNMRRRIMPVVSWWRTRYSYLHTDAVTINLPPSLPHQSRDHLLPIPSLSRNPDALSLSMDTISITSAHTPPRTPACPPSRDTTALAWPGGRPSAPH